MKKFACRDKGTESEEIVRILWLPPTLDFSFEIIRYVPDESDPFATTISPDLFRIYFGRRLGMGEICEVEIWVKSVPVNCGDAKLRGWIK